MFDYESLARKYNIRQDHLEKIISELRKEFPGDEMMVELHAVRVLKKQGETHEEAHEKEKYLS